MITVISSKTQCYTNAKSKKKLFTFATHYFSIRKYNINTGNSKLTTFNFSEVVNIRNLKTRRPRFVIGAELKEAY